VIVLLWIYYSAQILLFGAEFTQVYARRYGSQIRPAEDAIALTREAQMEQGMPKTKWEGVDEQGRTVQPTPILPIQIANNEPEPRLLPMDEVVPLVNGDQAKRPVGGAVIGLGAALVSFAVGLVVASKTDEGKKD